MRVTSAEQALDILLRQLPTLEAEDVERVILTEWASTRVQIEGDFHSELNRPFLEAYTAIDDELLRMFALARHGAADIRVLKQDELDEIDFRVKVDEGSSEISDNLWKLADKLSVELVGKMTGTEVLIAVLGLALIGGTAWGIRGFLENRKEVRLEELRSEERREAIAAVKYASSLQKEEFDQLSILMSEQHQITRSALDAAMNTNLNLLKATSQTDNVRLYDVNIDRSEARELRGSARRSATNKIIEQYMRVVDVNTADMTATSVIVSDPESNRQHRIKFRDRVVDAKARSILIAALDNRGLVWLRLSVKEVEGDINSMEILSVSEGPSDTNVRQIRPSGD